MRELVTLMALRGLSVNEIARALISMMARGKYAPIKGRIHLWTAPPFESFLCSLATLVACRHLSGLFDPDGIRGTAPKH